MTARRWVALAAGVVLALVGAFSAGRYTAPEKVRVDWRELSVQELTRGVTFTRTVTRVVYRDVTTTTTDAGVTVVDRSIEREGTGEALAQQETRHETHEATKATVTTLRPDWRVAAQVGASLRDPAIPITGPLVVGVSVERRILGGVSAGVWANTVGAAGVSVSVEF